MKDDDLKEFIRTLGADCLRDGLTGGMDIIITCIDKLLECDDLDTKPAHEVLTTVRGLAEQAKLEAMLK